MLLNLYECGIACEILLMHRRYGGDFNFLQDRGQFVL